MTNNNFKKGNANVPGIVYGWFGFKQIIYKSSLPVKIN